MLTKGASVDVAGQLLERPEDTGEELAFQMFADPENSEWNTIVYTDQTDLNLDTDDYVRVQGEVLGAFEGENAYRGEPHHPRGAGQRLQYRKRRSGHRPGHGGAGDRPDPRRSGLRGDARQDRVRGG